MLSFPTMSDKQPADQFSDEEAQRRYQATLKRVLSTQPQPKPKKPGDAEFPPKKRGRPAKEGAAP